MKKLFVFFICSFTLLGLNAHAQNTDSLKRKSKLDTAKNPFTLSEQKLLGLKPNGNVFEPTPANITTDVKYDPVSNRYIVTEMMGGKPFREPLYLTVEQYVRYRNTASKKDAWKQIVGNDLQEFRDNNFLTSIKVDDKFFNKVFGGGSIDITARGEIEAIMSAKINKNENPLLSIRQRNVTTLDFDQRIQAELSAQFGKNFKISTNYNTGAQFDFENRVKLEYTGKSDIINKIGGVRNKLNSLGQQAKNFGNGNLPDMTGQNLVGGQDGIIKNIEAGNVSMPLTGTLITGSQNLFGIKTQLQFGRLFVTALASQQRSQSRSIEINNGGQQNEFNLSASDYDANRHYFLAQYFRDNYNKFMARAPYVTSGINITRIEVWITNKNNSGTNSYQDARDVLALLDLGENKPYNTQLFVGGGSTLPSGFVRPSQPNQSNNILAQLPQDARFTNSSAVENYFANSGANDNYAKLTYARRLNQNEYTYSPYLGFVSLNTPLNNDEVLSVAYRYTYNGKEYQVGEFSNDVVNDANTPKMLITKMLKNENLRVYLPTWKLMMKNVYTIGQYNLSRDNFRLNVFRLDETAGVDKPIMADGATTQGKLWLQITGLDRLNQQMQPRPDGVFDFMEYNDPFGSSTTSAFGNTVNTNNNNSFGNTNNSNGYNTNNTNGYNTNTTNTTSSYGNSSYNSNSGAMGSGSFSSSSPLPSLNTNNIGGYVTIDPQKGRIIFPLVEPFGRDLESQLGGDQALIAKYVYRELYDSIKTVAQQYFPNKDRFTLKGSYQSSSGSVFALNAYNMPEGSVRVVSGNMPLQEGVDYTVDYQSGTVRIINTALLESGQPITINTEDNSVIGQQSRALIGSRLDYKVNNKLQLGATVMNLTEKPLTPKVNIGEEPISNTMWGVDATYSAPSRFLTKLVDKLPFLSTKAPSTIHFFGEFAQFLPGNPPGLNFAGSQAGVSYLDDFEGTQSNIDFKGAMSWQISSTPESFPESQLSNDLSYGYNRARLAFYNIDPAFYNSNTTINPLSPQKIRTELSNHFVRQVIEQEIFPNKQQITQTQQAFPTLNLAYYPNIRGPYNFTTTNVNSDGTLGNPQGRWGGIFRTIQNPDFESANVQYIEFWVMDPFIYKPTGKGGDLYFNLGNISEDILKDGRKSMENGLPTDRTAVLTDETNWGIVPRTQPVTQSFDADERARQQQDVGLDGINDDKERTKFAPQVQRLQGLLNSAALGELQNDPSSDDYGYYRGGDLDAKNAGIMQRYERYNNSEGNSKTVAQSQAELGVDNAAATALPDAEDVNRDNSMTTIDQYYEYKVSIRPEDLVVGKNYVTDKITSNVALVNGTSAPVTWYQIRIPIAQYDSKVGSIDDFKSMRFIRMYMTNFSDTTVLRFGEMGLVRGDWRIFNARNQTDLLIKEPQILAGADQSEVEVGSVSVENNGNKQPIPYVVPPGINREINLNNVQTSTQLDEQSLLMNVKNLRNGYGRAVFKSAINDFRSYEKLEMFVHVESLPGAVAIRDGDLQAFLRVGTDNNLNYYEYQKSLKVTLPGTSDPYSIWPEDNNFNFNISIFTNAKLARNKAKLPNGQPWPINVPFTYTENGDQVVVLGQPDLSKVRIYMLGVKNPTNQNGSTTDDAADKSAQVWFDEMRLSGFQRTGGWAVNGRVDAQLADFGNVSVSGSYKTAGFSALDTKIGNINRFDASFFDVSSNLDLGKFFKSKSGIKIPTFLNWSSQISTPEYDPRTPDVKLSNSLSQATRAQKDSILNFAQDFTTRSGIYFTNVRKERTNSKGKPHIWDIENFSISYGFSKFLHHDFVNANSIQNIIRGDINYNFSGSPKNYEPFKKIIKSKYLALLRDFNFTLLPSSLSFRMEGNKYYSENTLRNNDPLNFLPDISTQFNKNFSITRIYGAQWNLSKSLQVDFNAVNYALVDEPYGRITSQTQRDTLWNNLKNLGRTTNYGHNVGFNYTLPINKLPGFDWVTANAVYNARFDWQADPLQNSATNISGDQGIIFGNTIQNSRTMQLSPALDFTALYRKIPFLAKKMYDPDYERSFIDVFLDVLLGIKNIKGTYSRTDGTFMPGYLPKTNYFGLSNINTPGVGFILGSQSDLRNAAIANNWLSTDTLQSQLYVNTLNENLNITGLLQPISGLTINFKALRSKMTNYTTNFKFSPDTKKFESLSPNTQGNYMITTISLGTAFSDRNASSRSKIYEQFLANRAAISQRLGGANPNSGGIGADGFADGYNPNSQDVMVAAFNAAYLGKSANKASLAMFQNIPLPNWEVTYNGLMKLDIIKNIFNSFDVKHNYESIYNVGGFNSFLDYQESNGGVSSRDVNNNFLPKYQFQQVTIAEQFRPLIGIDMRFKSNLTAKLEYNKARMVNLSLVNSQLAQINTNDVVVGLGYRTNKFRMPFGLFANSGENNELNFLANIRIQDSKTVVYKPDVLGSEVSAGAKIITIDPSLEYRFKQRYVFKVFYNSSITQPYTSQVFNSSFTNVGFSIRFILN